MNTSDKLINYHIIG